MLRHPGSTPNSIESSKDFVRIIAYGVKGNYDDLKAYLSTIVQTYKNFTAGWQWARHEKINERMSLSTSNVSFHNGLSSDDIGFLKVVQFIKHPL